ncbi:5294_t:CDS:2 [Funneliformis geosporum]|uniref:5294_t:CDS:1 n=1 Tax=Funneliformis geosporum TaxID=1117311 RepID=A0A9W4WX70_9GLOM|nr:5294_t:CDS:2 [Funneliformis geosporum]
MIKASQNNAVNDTDFLEWIEYSQLTILEKINRGSFGTVYKAVWLDGLPRDATDDGRIWDRTSQCYVAVKFFSDYKDFLKEFTNIYRMIKNCSEEDKEISNIVRYYGATCDDNENEYGIVMEIYSQSSLSDYLTSNWRNIYWNKKLRILRDIAYGLYTLHYRDLIHGDLHSGNVMIDDNRYDSEIAFIGDLGFCRPEEKKIKDLVGLIPFMAPEIFKDSSYSKKADIYSFGIIMYYVSTNRQPFHDRAHNNKLASEIFNGLRPTLYQDDEIPMCFETLMRHCWSYDIRSRPNAYTLYQKFQNWIDGEKFEVVQYDVTEPLDESEFHRKAIYTSQTWYVKKKISQII